VYGAELDTPKGDSRNNEKIEEASSLYKQYFILLFNYSL
jgi:hypothetical protein